MRRVAVLACLALLPLGVAHGLGVELAGVRIVTTSDGSFLEMTIDAPDAGGRHDLLAVSTGQGAAVLERKQAETYVAVEAIPVGVSPERYGRLTEYRVRIPRPSRGATETLVTMVFGAGELVHANAVVTPPAERGAWSARPWVLALVALAGFGIGLQALRGRRALAS